MIVTAATPVQIGSTDWYLMEMHSDGDQCFHCGKVCMHVVTVRNAVDGRERTICHACSLPFTGEALDRREAARLMDETQEMDDAFTAPAASLFIPELDGPTVSAEEHYEYRAELDAERGAERWFESRGYEAARAQEAYELSLGILV